MLLALLACVADEDSAGCQCADTGEVLAAADFDDGAPGWTFTDGVADGAACGIVEGAYREMVLAPVPGEAPECWLELGSPLDLSGYSTAVVRFTYDASHYADAGGAHDAATIGFEATEGARVDWRTFEFSVADGDSVARAGAGESTLEDVVGWGTEVHLRIGLWLYTCADETRADCGGVTVDGLPWIAVDELRVEAW